MKKKKQSQPEFFFSICSFLSWFSLEKNPRQINHKTKLNAIFFIAYKKKLCLKFENAKVLDMIVNEIPVTKEQVLVKAKYPMHTIF